MIRQIIQFWKSKDVASMSLLALIASVVIWIVALPLSSTVQESYLRRFHLASSNFAIWAFQQPVPAMYNFENRVWTSPSPASKEQLIRSIGRSLDAEREKSEVVKAELASIENLDSPITSYPINHFPTRSFTFGHKRALVAEHQQTFFYLRSRYRDKEIWTTNRISLDGEGELQVVRTEVTID